MAAGRRIRLVVSELTTSSVSAHHTAAMAAAMARAEGAPNSSGTIGVVSLAGVLALGFLLAVSLVISTTIAALSTWVGAASPESAIGHAVNFAVSAAGRPGRPVTAAY